MPENTEQAAALAVQKTKEAQEAVEASRLAQTESFNKNIKLILETHTIEAKKSALEIVLRAENAAKSLLEVAEKSATRLQNQKPEWFLSHEKDDGKEFEANRNQNKEIIRQIGVLNDTMAPISLWFTHMSWDKKSRMLLLKQLGVISGVIIGLATVVGIAWTVIKYVVVHAIR